jgi:hypothetical protein
MQRLPSTVAYARHCCAMENSQPGLQKRFCHIPSGLVVESQTFDIAERIS